MEYDSHIDVILDEQEEFIMNRSKSNVILHLIK